MKNTSRRTIAAEELKAAFSLIRQGREFAELLSIAHINGAMAVLLGHTNGLVWADKSIKASVTRTIERAWAKRNRLRAHYATR